MLEKENTNYESLIIPEEPALVFNEKNNGRTLVIADLHIGYLYGKNRKGIVVPFKKSPEEDLLLLVQRVRCEKLIILGDFKDEIFGGPNPIAGRIWKFLRKILEETKVAIIKGNHDGKIEELVPEEVEIVEPTGLQLYDCDNKKTIGLWHGHATPGLEVYQSDITISGHSHPAYSFRDEIGAKITEKVWVKAIWKNSEERRIHLLMPAFNRYIDGYSVDGDYFNTTVLIKDALYLDSAEVFTLDGVLIGTIGELREAKKSVTANIKRKRKELSSKKKVS